MSEVVETPIVDAPKSDTLLTIVEQVSYTSKDNGETGTAYQFDRRLKTDDQVYKRINVKAGADWKPLDFGWLLDEDEGKFNVGLLVVKNEEGKFRTNPSAEERAEMEERILEVCLKNLDDDDEREIATPDLIVHVGESCRFAPAHCSIWIRCRKGEARYTVTAFPN
jgi:hypothetical protein